MVFNIIVMHKVLKSTRENKLDKKKPKTFFLFVCII